MPDNDRFEKLIRAVYSEYKLDFDKQPKAHPEEEDMACFFEGLLSPGESLLIKQHLIDCEFCCEAFACLLDALKSGEMPVPEELVAWAKDLVKAPDKGPLLEIILRLKENLLELVNTNGDVLVGQELMPAPLLRSRKITNFKEEITILKDFKGLRMEIKIENKAALGFSLIILIKEKQPLRKLSNLRISLLKDGVELESYVTDSARVVFENVVLGKYNVEISDAQEKIASALVDVKAD